MSDPLLFSPLTLRGVTAANRVVVSPMCQYSADNGYAGDHHLVHYGKFAMGGAGIVFLEATAVLAEGRITNGCLGLWEDGQMHRLEQIAAFLKAHGSLPAIQLAHAGRKASMQRPWHGNGPQTPEDLERGDVLWPVMAPSARALTDGWLEPRQMDEADMRIVREAFATSARRAVSAGFEVIEIHMGHGYLLQTFLSPLSNIRNDAYGGTREGRMRFPLETVDAVRAAIPDSVPVFVRISSVDGIDGGWELEDSIAFARELKARGVDVVDCSSGGNSPTGATNSSLKRGPGFQAPYARAIRAETGIKTQAVGLIRTAALAEELLQDGTADLIALGRQMLYDPFWPLHAAAALAADPDYATWPRQYGWWLEKWDKGLSAIGERP